jgi:predicted Zn-dependent protease with MMP-like domain
VPGSIGPLKNPWKGATVAEDLFEQIIRDVLKELPPDLKRALGTVQVVVQSRPSPEQLESAGMGPGEDLFGLFEGYSLKELPLGEHRLFPDRVVLFEQCLRRHFPGEAELARQVRVTVIHELGHYFGFTEEELKKRGWE